MSLNRIAPEIEEPEGLGESLDTYWSDYPLDTLLIRSETRTVFEILRRIEKGSFVMDPDFQRDFIWSDDVQSRFIESVLMRIPLPVFYLAEDENGRMIVVDGLQRLSTFRRFRNGNLNLKLKHQKLLHGKGFSDLSPKLQNRLEDCNLTLYVIDSKVPNRARLDIFERVNSGVPLTRQQMRNCLYMGPATRFLRNEAETDIFLNATGNSLKTTTMRNREFVNRFCAFQLLDLGDYKGDMDDFLATCLIKMNVLPEVEIQRLSADFRTSLSNNLRVFGKHAFRKHRQHDGDRSVINASLWDVLSTGLSKYSENIVEARADKLRNAFYPLMDDVDFVDSITIGTSDTRKVRHRFAVIKALFEGVFDADKA